MINQHNQSNWEFSGPIKSEDKLEKYLKLLKTDDPEEKRHHVLNPWHENGFSYATNGAIVIRVPGEYGDNDVGEFPKMADFNWPFFDTLENGITIPKYAFGEYQTCNLCSGQKHIQCPECDGDGMVYFENDYHEYNMQCASCSGRGVTELIETQKCWFCYGTNIKDEPYFLIDGQMFNPRYIKLLVDNLPDLIFYPKISCWNEDEEKASAGFSFDGGLGFIMSKKT